MNLGMLARGALLDHALYGRRHTSLRAASVSGLILEPLRPAARGSPRGDGDRHESRDEYRPNRHDGW